MQKKFGSIIDHEILLQAKLYCQKNKITMSHLIEKALSLYLKKAEFSSSPLSTVDTSFGSFKISAKTLEDILHQDVYETE